MPRGVYDICMLAGAALIVAGVAMLAGAPAALITAGALVIALTLLAARVG